MINMVYQWKTGFYQVEAQKAGEFLEDLSKREGGLLPSKVVDESRPQDAVLHECFEWKDDVAAEKYREQQARSLVRNIVTVNVIRGKEKEVPSFVNVSIQANNAVENRYVPIETAMNDQNMKAQVIQNALKELNFFRRKYNDISEFASLFSEIDRLFKAV